MLDLLGFCTRLGMQPEERQFRVSRIEAGRDHSLANQVPKNFLHELPVDLLKARFTKDFGCREDLTAAATGQDLGDAARQVIELPSLMGYGFAAENDVQDDFAQF